MTSIGRSNKNKLFTCFRPAAVIDDADDLLKPPLFMHITAAGKEKTVKFKVVPDSSDDVHSNGGCWGGVYKKKKTKTKKNKKKTSLIKRVLFNTKLIKNCRRKTEKEENSTSDETPVTHVSVEPEKVNRPAPASPPIKKEEEKFYSPCVGMSLILVPLIVLIIWGKGFAIVSGSICLYLIPGMLKGRVAELSRERNDGLKQSKKMDGLLERETSRNWRRVNW